MSIVRHYSRFNWTVQYRKMAQKRGACHENLPAVVFIKFPDDGLHAPGGRVYKESRERSRVIMGKETLYGYGFDYEWEMVPGEWVFEVWHGKAPLIRKRFTVVGPAATDDSE